MTFADHLGIKCVDFVLKNFVRMKGGELSVPKILPFESLIWQQQRHSQSPQEIIGIRLWWKHMKSIVPLLTTLIIPMN